jgi:hypothetical protein
MNPEQIIRHLISEGWKEFPAQFKEPGTIALARKHEGHAKCKCNEPKDKQLEVYCHPLRRIGGHEFKPRFTAENIGQLPNNQWLRMSIEGLTTLEEINQAVDSLLVAWDAAVEKTPYIEES